MKYEKPKKNLVRHPAQQGAALVMSLVLLLILTLIGIAALRNTAMQERMAGSLQDQNLAFQSAEAALREGEAALNVAVLPEFNGANGWHSWTSNSKPLWEQAPSDTRLSGAIAYSGEYDGVVAPQFFIEQLPAVVVEETPGGSRAIGGGEALEEIDIYRVTARGFGRNPGTVVILQSVYRR